MAASPTTQVATKVGLGGPSRNTFDRWAQAFEAPLFRLGLSFMGDLGEARQVVRKTLREGWEALEGFYDHAQTYRSLVQILAVEALERARGRHGEPFVERGNASEDVRELTFPGASLDAVGVTASSNSVRLPLNVSALAGMEAADRIVLLLHDVERLSVPEIAELLSLPLNGVQERLEKGRRKLQENVRVAQAEWDHIL